MIQPGNEGNVHHIIMYECFTDEGDSADIFEEFVGNSPVACYTAEMPSPYRKCLAQYSAGWVKN